MNTAAPLTLTTTPPVSRLNKRVYAACGFVLLALGGAAWSSLTKATAPRRMPEQKFILEDTTPIDLSDPTPPPTPKVEPVVVPPPVQQFQQPIPRPQPQVQRAPRPPRQPTEAELAFAKALKASPLAQPGQNGAAQRQEPQQVLEIAAKEPESPFALDGTMYGIKSPYTLMAGTTIPTTLISGLNSELPGAGFALVASDIYDTATQTKLLVPQGAKIQFRYNSETVESQSRLLVLAERIIFPPSAQFPYGSSVGLGRNPAGDLQGYGGLKDKVNRHLLQSFGRALIYAGVAAGTSLAEGGYGGGYHDPYNPSDAASQALSREMDRSANQALRRGDHMRPTFIVRPGYQFTVTLDKDLSFAQEWAAHNNQQFVTTQEEAE